MRLKIHGIPVIPIVMAITSKVSAEIVAAINTKSQARLSEIMSRSERYELFVVRKLMLLDIAFGESMRRVLLVKPSLVKSNADRWFPLDDPSLVKARVDHVVATICRWYASPEELVEDLTQAATEPGQTPSWIWVELMARMLEGGVKIETFTRCSEDAKAQIRTAVDEVHAITAGLHAEPARYIAVANLAE